MSIIFYFSTKIVSLGKPLRLLLVPLVATSIGLATGQQPAADPPLVGGFRIDYSDGDRTGGVKADEVLRAFEGTRAADVPAGSGVATAVKTNVGEPQKEAAIAPVGLPTDALPIAFPAAAPLSISAGGPTGKPNGGPASLIHAGEMIGFSRDLGDGVQAITIINASRRWMAVYHIDSSGQIRLTSSRSLDADFTIQFNATAPLPDDIRRLQGK